MIKTLVSGCVDMFLEFISDLRIICEVRELQHRTKLTFKSKGFRVVYTFAG